MLQQQSRQQERDWQGKQQEKQQYGQQQQELASNVAAAESLQAGMDLSAPESRQAAVSTAQEWIPRVAGSAGQLGALESAGTRLQGRFGAQPASTSVAAPTRAAVPEVVGKLQQVIGYADEIEQAFKRIDPLAVDNTDAWENYRAVMLSKGVSESQADTAILKQRRTFQKLRDDFFLETVLRGDNATSEGIRTGMLRFGVSPTVSVVGELAADRLKAQEEMQTGQLGLSREASTRAAKAQDLDEAWKAVQLAQAMSSTNVDQAKALLGKGAQIYEKYNPDFAQILRAGSDSILGSSRQASMREKIWWIDRQLLSGDPVLANETLANYGAMNGLWPDVPKMTLTAEHIGQIKDYIYKQEMQDTTTFYNIDATIDRVAKNFAEVIMSIPPGQKREAKIGEVISLIMEGDKPDPQLILAKLEELGVLKSAVEAVKAEAATPEQPSGSLAAVIGKTVAKEQLSNSPSKGLGPVLPQSSEMASTVEDLFGRFSRGKADSLSPGGSDSVKKQLEKNLQEALRRTGDMSAARREVELQFRLSQ